MFKCEMWCGSDDDLRQYAEILSQEYDDPNINYDYMYWKHVLNPNGKSLVALAKNASGLVVAGRAFLRCSPLCPDVFQPCDTVTHHSARRQGLFERLTKLCLAELNSEVLVLNFPNANSMPGYLKLGWSLLAHQELFVSFGWRYQKFSSFEGDLCDIQNLFGVKVARYIKWRFGEHPFFRYKYCIYRGCLLIRRGLRYGCLYPKGSVESARVVIPFGFGVSYRSIRRRIGSFLVYPLGVGMLRDSNSNIVARFDRNDSEARLLSELLHVDSFLLMDTF